MEYFIPKTGTITQPNGKPLKLVRGIHDLPDAVADSQAAIAYGVKPIGEMTDAEWRSTGHKKPALDGAVKTTAGATVSPALDGAVRKS